jgi:hypothetical protein
MKRLAVLGRGCVRRSRLAASRATIPQECAVLGQHDP